MHIIPYNYIHTQCCTPFAEIVNKKYDKVMLGLLKYF